LLLPSLPGISTGFTGLTGYSNARADSFAHHRTRILYILFILSKSACRVSSYENFVIFDKKTMDDEEIFLLKTCIFCLL